MLGELELELELEQGQRLVLMLGGPAGIGKTEVLRLTPARASELQLHTLQAKGAEPAEQERLLTGAAGRVRIALRQERRTTAREGSPQDGVDAVLHGLYWLTVNLSEQAPLLLVVDDELGAGTKRGSSSGPDAHRAVPA